MSRSIVRYSNGVTHVYHPKHEDSGFGKVAKVVGTAVIIGLILDGISANAEKTKRQGS